MVMGKGDCLHTLAQSAQLGAQALGTSSSTSKDMNPDSRLGWRDTFGHDVVSPLGVLFWGILGYFDTFLVSHPGQFISPHWDCFKAGRDPVGWCRLWQVLSLAGLFGSNTTGNNVTTALLCAMCQRHMLKNHPGPPRTCSTNHLPPWDKGMWPPAAATEPWEGQPSSL